MLITVALLGMGVLFGDPAGAKEGSAPSEKATARVDAAAREAFAPLPGSQGFVFTELTEAGPRQLFGLHPQERFAIGSGFKLFILGTLAADLNAERRQLENVAKLQADWIGPPHSELAEWPLGSPVTLNTLALKMISISDNTATDHLLHLLGRENIEMQMRAMGHRHAEWNTPLLSTREMVALRDKSTGMPGERYQTLDLPARRKFLEEIALVKPNYDKLDFDTSAYDVAEWYATPLDMANAMAWLKTHTEKDQPAHPLRAILAVDPKLVYDAEIWPYVGFKGGSEDQLLAGNWLLKHRNGRWYTFHAFCNSPQQKLAPQEMVKAVQHLFAALQETIE